MFIATNFVAKSVWAFELVRLISQESEAVAARATFNFLAVAELGRLASALPSNGKSSSQGPYRQLSRSLLRSLTSFHGFWLQQLSMHPSPPLLQA